MHRSEESQSGEIQLKEVGQRTQRPLRLAINNKT